jgi:virulence factor Mce-like protein
MKMVAVFVAVCTVLATSGCGAVGATPGTKFAAMFRTAIGIYPNADVRVLGVPVGKVDQVTPQGQLVRVDFHVQDDVQVPADVKAVVVAQTVVADRFIQLAPVYTQGPTLAEGTVIPVERTASPAEFDDLLASAQKLSTSLGPEGANSTGALSQALTTASRNLQGNGQQLNTTLDNTSQAINTLSANRENLAGTVKNLQSFTSNLKNDDPQVREFTQKFAEVNSFLAGERQDLGDTLQELSTALGDVAKFVKDNRKEVRDNVDQLHDVLKTVNNERIAIEQVLETAPMGLDGLVNAYNAGSATLDTRTDLLGTLFCLLGSQLPPPLGQLLLGLVAAAFPGDFDPTATCNNLGGSAAAASPLSLSPKTKAQLTDPRFAAAMGQLMSGLAARSAARRSDAGPVPSAGVPLAGVAPGALGATDRNRRPGPPPPPSTLGGLLGGGR